MMTSSSLFEDTKFSVFIVILALINVSDLINPECFRFFGKPFVDASTISLTLTTTQEQVNGTVEWSPQVNVSWAEPSDSYVGSYVVLFEVIPISPTSEFIDCTIQTSDIVVNESMLIKNDLLFGFDYKLTVQTTNELSTRRNTLSSAEKIFSTNDCYLETLDEQFCSSRPTETQVVGAVYNLRIDSMYPNVTDPSNMIVKFSWLTPLQLNPEYEIDGYRVMYIEDNTEQMTAIGTVPHENDNTKDFRYSSLAAGLQPNESYTIKIGAFVSKSGIAKFGKFVKIKFVTPVHVPDQTTTTRNPTSTVQIVTKATERDNNIVSTYSTETQNTNTNLKPDASSSDDEKWLNENRTVVIIVIVCASLLVIGSLAFACYIAQVKDEKVEHQRKIASLRKIDNEYL